MIDEDFASVEQTMSEGIQEAKQGLEIIQQVQTALPDIRKLGDQANDLGNVIRWRHSIGKGVTKHYE